MFAFVHSVLYVNNLQRLLILESFIHKKGIHYFFLSFSLLCM